MVGSGIELAALEGHDAARPPATRTLDILQVSTYDAIGGAERVAWRLFEAYREQGHRSWLAVGHKLTDDPAVFEIPNGPGNVLSGVGKLIDLYRGVEDFRFPGTWQLLELTPRPPDVIHGHNLHGAYFDLRALPWLSHRVPIVLTLHDAWLLSGHCAHSLDCDRWLIGCGHCPDLTLDPPVRRDAYAHKFRRSRRRVV